MTEWLQYAGLIILGAILYAIGYEMTKAIIDYLREKSSSIKKAGKINLSGKWYAIWQTTTEGKQNINTEVLKIKQKGRKIKIENREKSPENKLGGYLWMSKCKLYDNEHLLGHYISREANVVSKGTLYFLLNRVGEFMVGKWVGCNYDYEFTWGFGVIAKDKDFAIEKMQKLLTTKRGLSKKQGDVL